MPSKNRKQFEEKKYLQPVPLTSSYLPVKDSFVLHPRFKPGLAGVLMKMVRLSKY
jgi:hypothetical protein